MGAPSFLKLLSRSPLHAFLQTVENTTHVLQIHAQSIANPVFSHPSSPSCLLFTLSQLPSHLLPSSYINHLFSQIQIPNSFIYNTVIKLHCKTSHPHLSLEFFVQMKRNGVKADNYTYPFVLKASNMIPMEKFAILIHGEVLKAGFATDLFVSNGLITSYCKLREISLAGEIFDGSMHKDVVSWNSMMSGYIDSGELHKAQNLFDEMPERDAVSWDIMINGYAKIAGNVSRARELFDQCTEKDMVCWNSMIDGYSRAGDMSSAQELFDLMPKKNVVSWSIMIDGNVRHGNPKEAFQLFHQMLRKGTRPDKVCAVGAITACAQLGALDQGQWIHSYLDRKKILLDVVVKTSLIDMYMKCGRLDIARRFFEGIHKKSVVTWNVMIVGLGSNGHGAEAIELFHQMEKEGALMDDLTFLAVLSACTHGGLIDEGLHIFARMRYDFRIEPKVEHYGCLVDLLGRAGRLEEAKDLIDKMPMKPTPALWGSLLATCRTHRCVNMAEQVVDELASLGGDDSGVYVLMSNIYADEGMWDGVWRMRKLMGERGMKKETGRSEIEVDGIVHEFVNGDCSHSCKEEIYAFIWNLFNEMVTT